MKFCNLLREASVEIPDILNLYLCYKRLKKHIKSVSLSNEAGDIDASVTQTALFNNDLKRFADEINNHFIETEEQYVIKMGCLEEQARAANNEDACRVMRRCLVDFQGEITLFIYGAMMAYAALVKILKKNAKKMGGRLEIEERQRLLGMPVCSTEVAVSILRSTEQATEALSEKEAQFRSQQEPAVDGTNGEMYQASTLMNRLRVALSTWEQLKTTAVTPSTILADHLAVFPLPSVSGSVSNDSSSDESGYIDPKSQ